MIKFDQMLYDLHEAMNCHEQGIKGDVRYRYICTCGIEIDYYGKEVEVRVPAYGHRNYRMRSSEWIAYQNYCEYSNKKGN